MSYWMIIQLLVAICLLAATTLYFTSYKNSNGQKVASHKKQKPTILIAGRSGAGKTSLFHKLINPNAQSNGQFVTSIQENVLHGFKLEGAKQKMTIVEYPGHHKLQQGLIQELQINSKIRCIIFVIDSTFSTDEQQQDAAQLLHTILRILDLKKTSAPILVACNKSDLFTARPPKQIKKILESAIDSIIKRRRQAQSQTQEELDEEQDSQLDSMGQFAFEKLDNEVTFIPGSVHANKLDKWHNWIIDQSI